MSKETPYSDWRTLLVKGLVQIRRPLAPIVWVLDQFLVLISPNIPTSFRKSFGSPFTRRSFWITYLLTLFFCFGVNVLLCAWEGTLSGVDPERRYFVQDGWNIGLYLFICPTYAALAIGMMRITIGHWEKLIDYADEKTSKNDSHHKKYRLPTVFVLILLMCTGFITNYMYDVLNPSIEVAEEARIYWFMNATSDGIRMLNRVGYYYVVLNFALLFITLAGTASFLSLAIEVLRAAESNSIEKIDSFTVLESRLQSFTDSYLLTKGATAAYVLNLIIWAVSPLGNTSNLLVSQIALSVIGVFFIALPRQYIQLRWYELWDLSGKRFKYKDTRQPHVRLIASLLNALFISALLSTWGLDIKSISEWVSSLFSG